MDSHLVGWFWWQLGAVALAVAWPMAVMLRLLIYEASRRRSLRRDFPVYQTSDKAVPPKTLTRIRDPLATR